MEERQPWITLGGLTSKKNIAEIVRMLKVLIKSLKNKPLNPRPLGSLDPLLQLNWRRTETINILEESRKAFKSKRLEALRKKLTQILIDAV